MTFDGSQHYHIIFTISATSHTCSIVLWLSIIVLRIWMETVSNQTLETD
jgi:hypothetical protein